MTKKSRTSTAGKSPGGASGGAKKPTHSMSQEGRGKGSQSMRSAATVRRLLMYKQKPVRDKKGKLIKQDLQSKELPITRIVPDRRWFGNTRVVGQKELSNFREEIAAKQHDPYTVLLKQKQLPMGLLTDATKIKQMKLLEVESYSDTFGGKSKRKRPKIGAAASSLEAFVAQTATKAESYEPTKDPNIQGEWEAATHKGESHLFERP